MPLRAHLSAFLAHNMDFYDCLKLRESDPCTSKLGLLARSRMAQQEGLLAGYASSLQLARRASGISWCGLCIAISGLLMASFWKWSTQTAGDLSMTLRWLLDDPRPCISTDAIGAAAAATNTNAAEHGTETLPHRRGTTPFCHADHKFWKPWPNAIR
jgi:hypothetical protein